MVDENDRVNLLLLANSLDNVSGGKVHRNWVAAASDLVAETLNLAERALESILCDVSFLRYEAGVSCGLPIEPRTGFGP